MEQEFTASENASCTPTKSQQDAHIRFTALEYALRLTNPSSDANYLIDNAKKIEAYLKGKREDVL